MGEVEALWGGMELGAALFGGSAQSSAFVAPTILLVNSRRGSNTWNDSRQLDGTWNDSRQINNTWTDRREVNVND